MIPHTRPVFMLLMLVTWLFAASLSRAEPPAPLEAAGEEAPAAEAGEREVGASVAVTGDDFVKARGRAVHEALKKALKEALRERMGEREYAAHGKELRSLLANPERYVRSYRFLDAADHFEEKTSEVLLSVSLYTQAVQRALGDLGMLSGPGASDRVVVVIRESGNDPEPLPLWEQHPISEMALAGLIAQSGMDVVPRGRLRALFSEEQVQRALEGDIAQAVHIGWKAGADTVILGNAVSTPLGETAGAGPARVRSILSVKAVSVRKSAVIAAKSDFAQGEGQDLQAAEEKALKIASSKITKFLVDSLHRLEKQKSAPVARPRVESFPMPVNDL